MGFGNSPGQHTVIALEARRSFAFGLQFKKVSGEAVSLTGATVRFVLAQPQHKGGAVLLTKTATAVDLALGLVQVELQAVDTDLDEAEYPFAVTLVSAAGYSTPVMKGTVDLRDNADPATTGTYTGFNPSTELAVYLEDGGLVEVRVAQLDGMTLQVQSLLTNFTLNMAAEVEEAAGHAMLAQTHATNAGVSAEAATDAVADVTTQATAAAASAAAATTKAGQAATSAATATTAASTATTKATEAEASAAAAAASAAAASGEVGAVLAAGVTYSSLAGVEATNVRDALDELATEKADVGHTHEGGGAGSVEATGDITKLHGPITQAEYDALDPVDPDTLYVIVG